MATIEDLDRLCERRKSRWFRCLKSVALSSLLWQQCFGPGLRWSIASLSKGRRKRLPV